ncbi:MAG: acetylglutamate kinase [Bryobacterales bacterium]|nr:acetylglutamate kinase [Bryobacteraceae bacterium]MDW8131646.1 acetylglutamate kinase [Bryobacterales bacterium]
MKVLVKLGGSLLESQPSRERLAAELAAARREGLELVVVHGGGKQMSRFLAERNVASRFVGGLRVTTPEVLDAVIKVVAGSVNRELVATLVAAGARAVGLSGVDDCLLEARAMGEELGAVGRPAHANTELLDLLVAHGFLPVIACVGADRQGRIYNVNADQMAAALASGFRADSLILLTDVGGVLAADGRILPQLTASQARRLIADGVATGGMQAKLEAAIGALEAGVRRIVIAAGAEPGVIARALAGDGPGTRLIREENLP